MFALHSTTLVSYFALFSVSIVIEVNAGQTAANVIKQVIESIRNGCELRGQFQSPSPSSSRIKFDKIHLPSINVKHLIVGADVFDVYLNETQVTGIDSFQIDAVSSSPSDSDEIIAMLRFPTVSVDCVYTANGSIGQTFPVNGKGTLKIEYTNVTSELVLLINRETHSIAESGLGVKSLHYEFYSLKVSPKSSDDTLRVYRKGSSRSNGEMSQLSQVLFWKFAMMTSIELEPKFETCINSQLSKPEYSLQTERTMAEQSQLQPQESALRQQVIHYSPSINEYVANGTQMWFIPLMPATV